MIRQVIARIRLHRPAWLVVAAVLLVGCLLSLALPWYQDAYALPAAVRIAMALSGVALLTGLALRPPDRTRGVLPLVGAIGAGVAAYPTLMTLAAAGVGGAALTFVASGWHVLPLTLVQLAPVAASTLVLGRRRRSWEIAIVVAAVISTGATVLALTGAPPTDVWVVASSVIFAGSFLIAPIATWAGVAGTRGETRRRATLAALAAMFPVVIIVGCTAVNILTAGIGASEDVGVAALLLGFSVGSLLCGLTVVATTAPAGSPLLRTRVIVLTLDGLVGAIVLICALVVSLVLPADRVPPGWALLAGGVAVAVLILPWLRLHTWVGRVLDPTAELRHELDLVGEVGEGQQRRTVLLVLRRLIDDPELTLVFRVDATTWVGVDGAVGPGATGATVPLAARAGEPSVLARPSDPDGTARLLALGDVGPLLGAALLEATAVHEAARAEAAAENERRQVERDLHDGLQGRLLGLALNLQLSGRDVDDPAARLLLEETVTGLRSTAEDVRALGSGRQPELLAASGLAPALGSLFRYARPVVELDVPATRFPAEVETAAYFVVGEAVTNALKHAEAGHVAVRIRAAGGTLTITVSDDGRGGADPRLGSGLRALAERVAATGGALVVREGVREGVPSGTVVEAVVPCGS